MSEQCVPLTLGEALTPTEVIEFCNGVDWFQLSQVVGHRNPLHRWRVVGFRGDVEGEWTWRRTSKLWIKRWSHLPCQIVPIGQAHTDPLTRWPMGHAVEMERRLLRSAP
jgi:hypothetical protein